MIRSLDSWVGRCDMLYAVSRAKSRSSFEFSYMWRHPVRHLPPPSSRERCPKRYWVYLIFLLALLKIVFSTFQKLYFMAFGYHIKFPNSAKLMICLAPKISIFLHVASAAGHICIAEIAVKIQVLGHKYHRHCPIQHLKMFER